MMLVGRMEQGVNSGQNLQVALLKSPCIGLRDICLAAESSRVIAAVPSLLLPAASLTLNLETEHLASCSTNLLAQSLRSANTTYEGSRWKMPHAH